MHHHRTRMSSACVTFAGLIFNACAAVHIFALSRSLKYEPELGWSSGNDTFKVDSIKVAWILFLSYFVSAAAVDLVGFVGVVKTKPALIRFYRDYSIADFVFSAVATAASAYSTFQVSTRTGVCEEMSRQPELLRNMTDLGLSLENCERWFERAVMAFAACMVLVLVVRLHFLLAVSRYYTHLTRRSALPTHVRTPTRQDSLQRIFIIPRHSQTASTPASPTVYAPVPLEDLTPELRRSAMEAWVKRTDLRDTRHHRSSSGRISLPIQPDEGLLPAYTDKA
ncbi:hypothetical protein CYLTODRAFT_341362 [Cylindrobasidium torrendii FP15055 ss-10]|uniref:Uncharacterized protein n=1 Tax=Cylindrobasidium torrendii FP15055 ss-10 TaxID=1314674 RepID=A0A0D7BUF8_9AGAR|nr:hypothetical protein CYLTODRAFT_341362 [Cylindrobasidium torrendii FP15055 ss-10]